MSKAAETIMKYSYLVLSICLLSSSCIAEPNFSLLASEESIEQERDMMTSLAGMLNADSSMPMLGGQMEQGGTIAGNEMGGSTFGGEALGGDLSAGTEAEAGSMLNPSTSAIIGHWVSEGSDIAPLLAGAPFNLATLDARFLANSEFSVMITNQDGESFTLAGTYLVPTGSRDLEIHAITLNQSLPEPSISEGIWRVENDILSYEVVQVSPALPGNNTPPSVEAGFGSSNQGELGSANIQIYRRRP